MERYENLDFDLECEGGGGAEKTSLFSGMFRRSTKSAEPSVQAQNSLSAKSEFSKSDDSLTDSSTTEKGGVFTGMFKKTTKAAKESQPQGTLSFDNPEVSASTDSLTDNKSSKEKSGVLGGILKRSPKPGHVRRPSQDLLVHEVTPNTDSLSEKTTTKETGGMFGGMFKKTSGGKTQSQDDLSAPSKLSGSTDNLSVNSNTKEAGGIFSGMFKKSPKPFGSRTQSQDDLSAPSELSGSTDNLSVNSNTKEAGGIFSGMFKKSPKPFGSRTQSQDDLSAPSELSGSTDNLSENNSAKEKGGFFSGVFKKKVAKSQSQDDLSVEGELSASSDHLIAKSPKEDFSAVKKSTFYTDKQEKNSGSDCEEILDNGEGHPSHKQSKFSEAMTKLNPFRSANKNEKQAASDEEDPPAGSEKASGNKQKDNEDPETLKKDEKQVEEKPKVVKHKMNQRERKEKGETPPVPARPTAEEMKGISAYGKVKPRGTEDIQELNREVRHGRQKQKSNLENQSDVEGIKNDESAEAEKGDEANPPESKTSKVKKPKTHNAFMSHAAAKSPSDDEGLKDEDGSASQEEKKDDSKDKTEEKKVKKPKRFNPFMPRVKTKGIQRPSQDGAEGNTGENEGGNRSLFDQLEDFRIDPAQPDDSEDVENLMDWWNSVESWEDTPQDDDMTEKEEAKAFAVTAEKVQKGIRVFNKLFSERAESLWQHVIDLNSIADGLDKFSKNTKIAQITGGSTSAIGGVATIAGLALAPVTFGASLIVTAVGLGVATAGGLTSAGAGISNQVNNSMDRKKVEKIVHDYQEKMTDLNKCLKFIKQGIENLKRFDLIKMKKHAYNRDFPVLSSSFYEDGAMAGKAILVNANEIMRVVQIANVAGSTAARAVQIASMATGVLTGLFVGMDIYFVAKDSKELRKGAKSEFAAKIREVATQLHDGLVELNTIRQELQTTTPEDKDEADDTAAMDSDKKEKDYKYDSSDEDEIDRIKKAIKEDYENREYI